MSDSARLVDVLAQQLMRLQPGPPDFGAADAWLAAKQMRRAGGDPELVFTFLRMAVSSWGEVARSRLSDGDLARIVDRVFQGPLMTEATPFTSPGPRMSVAEMPAKLYGALPPAEARAVLTTLVTPPAAPAVENRLHLRLHADRLRERQTPLPMLIAGALPLGGVGAIVAMPGAGKTLVAVEVARCVAAGAPFLGRATLSGRVIYACPDSPASTERRLLALPEAIATRIASLSEVPALPGSIPDLRATVEELNAAGAAAGEEPVRLIVIDTWDSARSHVGDGYAGQDALIESAMGGLRKLADDLRLSVLIVHHATRGDHGRARGSVVFDARADWIAVAEGDGRTVKLKSTKCRDGERGDLGTFVIRTVAVGGAGVPLLEVASADEAASEQLKRGRSEVRLYALLKHVVVHEGKHTATSLMTALGLPSKGSVSRLIDRLREMGYLNHDDYHATPAGKACIDGMFDGASLNVPADECDDPPGRVPGRPSRMVQQ